MNPSEDLIQADGADSNEPPTVNSVTPSADDSACSKKSASASEVKRKRITNQNNEYGFMEGAQHGGQPFSVLRMKPPLKLESKSDISTRFLDQAKDIVYRAERLGLETGCWIYLAAQHQHAQGPMISFATQRLRLEAHQQLTEYSNNFNRLMASLVMSRRQDAAQSHIHRLKAQEKLAATTQKLDEKDALIKELQLQLLSK
ncbi:hypothetical protein HGRIS_013305 [Hohenbuehelia grisea]|uniref:Uncharacterized protein n=1 Tax=Hohenbuehelia grisea TaxID=104357 RepID=A0ABR3IV44_9AGAR